MGIVQKKVRKDGKNQRSQEEKLQRDIQECMKCKFFWGNDSRCINNKCCKEEKKPIAEKKVSKCDGCPYRQGERYCFPCMRDLLGK